MTLLDVLCTARTSETCACKEMLWCVLSSDWQSLSVVSRLSQFNNGKRVFSPRLPMPPWSLLGGVPSSQTGAGVYMFKTDCLE